jgi:phosphatidylserine/phosphatidylglycerophosphate/cardiolipin synthase-like enzyme
MFQPMRAVLLALVAVVLLTIGVGVGFVLGWNRGADMEQAKLAGASDLPDAPPVRPPAPTAAAKATDATPMVYFSPRGGCTQAVVSEINKAKTEILVQAYSFTSEPIGAALVSALRRGVKVTASLDEKANTSEKTIAGLIADSGADVRLDGKHAISHSKVMVIDGQTVVTGSFNFTNQAEHSNLENLLVIHSAELAKLYADNFQEHWTHTSPYVASAAVEPHGSRR